MAVILVDEQDKEIGHSEKIEAHWSGKLHRAFSIFVFNSKGETLLQKRSHLKYHSGGLWSNTCCSHPRPGKDMLQEAVLRLRDEMGFTCELSEKGSFIYKAELENNMIEHEFDHVLVGKYEKDPEPNHAEVDDFRWIGIDELKKELGSNPEKYTYWLKEIISRFF